MTTSVSRIQKHFSSVLFILLCSFSWAMYVHVHVHVYAACVTHACSSELIISLFLFSLININVWVSFFCIPT
jgi:hypothetical protein